MKKWEMFISLIVFLSAALFAQTAKTLQFVQIKEKSAVHVPPQEAPAGLKKIYSNLGPKNNPYRQVNGWLLRGPNSQWGGVSFFYGLPFTPKSNSHISQVQVAIQYDSGTNQIDLSIYEDSNGVPGTLLAGPVTVTNLPDLRTCCLLAVANFSPVAVATGTQYWVVADTPLTGTGSDFSGVWCPVSKPVILMGTKNGSDDWSQFNADSLPAGEVLGTVP